MILHAKAIAIGAAVVAAVLYSKRSAAAPAANPLGPLAPSTPGAGGSYGVGTSATGNAGLSSLLKSVMDAITAPANAFTPASSLPSSVDAAAAMPVTTSGVQGLATVAAPEPTPYYSPRVTSSEQFWAVATAPEPLPGVWGYTAPGAAPVVPQTSSVSYDETGGTSGASQAPQPAYGSNLELASREWIDWQANTGGAGSGV